MPTTPTNQPPEPGRLRELLERLHEELHNAAAIDPHTRDLLRGLQEDTRVLLEKGDENVTPGHGRLRDRLAAEVARLEGTHPDLAMAMAQVVDTLSGLGI